jgi:hypothetical protein
MAISEKDVSYSQVLTDVSLKYQNAAMVGEQLFTPVPVQKNTGLYYEYGKQDLRLYNLDRAPGSPSKEIDWAVTRSQPFYTEEIAVSMPIPREVEEVQDTPPLNLQVDTTEYLTNIILLNIEKKIADMVQDTALYPTDHVEDIKNDWGDDESDPITKIRHYKNVIRSKIIMEPNTLLLGAQVYNRLLDHPKIVDRIKYTQLGITTQELMAKIFEVDRLLVGRAVAITSKERKSEEQSDIWGNVAILAYVTPTPGLKQITFGYLFRQRGYRAVETWYDDHRRSTFVRVIDKFVPKVVCNLAAAYLYNCV